MSVGPGSVVLAPIEVLKRDSDIGRNKLSLKFFVCKSVV
jgi:hypothetical protein